MTRPVFFRLLDSSIRTTEARKLKRKEVDLVHGVLEICETKGYAQHYVALHGSMTDLLKQYDREVEKIYPGRTYCFENAMGSSYSRQWVVYIFRKLWEKANGKTAGTWRMNSGIIMQWKTSTIPLCRECLISFWLFKYI